MLFKFYYRVVKMKNKSCYIHLGKFILALIVLESAEFYLFGINQPSVYCNRYTHIRLSSNRVPFDRIIHFNEIYARVPPGSRSRIGKKTFLRKNPQSPLKKNIYIAKEIFMIVHTKRQTYKF